MKLLFHLGHPAHFHLFKNVIAEIRKNGHQIIILIKKKDVLEDLLNESGLDYQNILPDGRKDSKIGIAIGQIKQDLQMLKFCIRKKVDLLVGTSVAISHVGKILSIPSLNVNEDDAEIVPLYAKLAYPWASIILTPEVCSVGKWSTKKIGYNGYHELAYLHPNHFSPQKRIAEKYMPAGEKYFVIRFAKLKAHHDTGVKGIDISIAQKLIEILSKQGRVYITSERILEPELEKFRISINPVDMHHILAFAELYIGDSQTMAAEAGVLGTPFIRFNDFVGRIGYLNELENEYQLGFGIKPANPDLLLKTTKELLEVKNRKEIFQERRQKMLMDKIDYAKFLSWFIESYPQSVEIIKETPEYQYNFK
jgi:predicted glycosyltransferase